MRSRFVILFLAIGTGWVQAADPATAPASLQVADPATPPATLQAAEPAISPTSTTADLIRVITDMKKEIAGLKADKTTNEARAIESCDKVIEAKFVHVVDDMQKKIDDLKADKAAHDTKAIESGCDKVIDTKYGPNAPVTTKTGKLRIGALTQIWYYGIQKDSKGLFQDNNINGIQDTNEASDNSSFRIRRTELHFQMDMTPEVTSYVIVDPAREATGYPNLPNPQGFFKKANQVGPEFAGVGTPGLNSTSLVSGVQNGGGSAARALQDAWIDFHDSVPHHDFTVGQVHPWFGEEGIRTSRELDFCERSQIGFIGDSRDLGASIHGAWWDVDKDTGNVFSPSAPGRFQYWLAVWDGAGNFHSAGAFQNRPADHNAKDFNYRVLVRPLWKSQCGGSMELGMSSQFGQHGDSKVQDPINVPYNGVDRTNTWAIRHDAWLYYAPGGPVKGLWVRGEYAFFRDRESPGTVIDLTGAGSAGGGFAQANGNPFTTEGYYAAVGYKLSDTPWAGNSDCGCGRGLPEALKRFEFAFRYDSFQNVEVADPRNEFSTLVYKTSIYTAGINYYIKGHNAKIQLNYNWVQEPGSGNEPAFQFHRTSCNNFIMNFQVGF